MVGISKADQLSGKRKESKVCIQCNILKPLELFEGNKGYKCLECKRKSRGIKKQSQKGYNNIREDNKLRKKVRKRDNDTCQWCGKIVTGFDSQMSHVISKGSHPELRHDIMNVKLLCYYCHQEKWHAHPKKAMKWFQSKFPNRYKYLMEKIKE